jgi:N-carbamoylputrescine amidase
MSASAPLSSTSTSSVSEAGGAPVTSVLRIGLVQQAHHGSREANLARAAELVRRAATEGARIVCLQELVTTAYFCRDENPAHFDLAEPIPGPTTREMGALAAELGIVLIVPLFERRDAGVFFNSAVVLGPDGAQLALYRKMHIPDDPSFMEKFYFTPGDLGWCAAATPHGEVGVLICWDQWFPEAARATAMAGAKVLFYPTAIGWLPDEKEALGEAQHDAWEVSMRAHAVANGVFVAAPNRVGREGEVEFWGQSFVAGPDGRVLARATADQEEVLVVECNHSDLEEQRRWWPFFRDRRIDAYAPLLHRYGRG